MKETHLFPESRAKEINSTFDQVSANQLITEIETKQTVSMKSSQSLGLVRHRH